MLSKPIGQHMITRNSGSPTPVAHVVAASGGAYDGEPLKQAWSLGADLLRPGIEAISRFVVKMAHCVTGNVTGGRIVPHR